jgi:hypothetical protein
VSAQGPINPPTPGVAPEGGQSRSLDTIGDDDFTGPTQVHHSGHEHAHENCTSDQACTELAALVARTARNPSDGVTSDGRVINSAIQAPIISDASNQCC